MKKLLLILLTLGTGSLFAQYGTNSYYDGNAYATTTNTYTTGGNCGTSYAGGTSTYAPACAPSRVRWENSSCGTFRWRIVENSFWVPGGYVYINGCRRWNDGYYDWRPCGRVRINHGHTCHSGCGHGYGNGYNAPRPNYGGGHGHNGGYSNGHHGNYGQGGPRGNNGQGGPRGNNGQGGPRGNNGQGGNGGYGQNSPNGPRR